MRRLQVVKLSSPFSPYPSIFTLRFTHASPPAPKRTRVSAHTEPYSNVPTSAQPNIPTTFPPQPSYPPHLRRARSSTNASENKPLPMQDLSLFLHKRCALPTLSLKPR